MSSWASELASKAIWNEGSAPTMMTLPDTAGPQTEVLSLAAETGAASKAEQVGSPSTTALYALNSAALLAAQVALSAISTLSPRLFAADSSGLMPVSGSGVTVGPRMSTSRWRCWLSAS